MTRINTEVVVGFFLLLGLLALGYLAVKLGKMEVVGSSGYTVQATFSNVAGLRVGTSVEIAGVDIGWVEGILSRIIRPWWRFASKMGCSSLRIRSPRFVPKVSLASNSSESRREVPRGIFYRGMRSKKRSHRWTLWN